MHKLSKKITPRVELIDILNNDNFIETENYFKNNKIRIAEINEVKKNNLEDRLKLHIEKFKAIGLKNIISGLLV